MILFIAPFPALSDEKDGMVQRVKSIDSLVSDLPRIYLDISFRRFWTRQVHHFGEATVFQLNGLAHFLFILRQIKQARMVYVHSVFYSMKAIPAYWMAKPITDLHGAVPEEFAYQGKPLHSRLYGLVERIALRRSSAVVHVTSAMKRHFQRKYGRDSKSDRTIAIIPKMSDPRGYRENIMAAVRNPKGVIYAGGLQAWQNVELMLEAASTAPELNFVFLSGEADVIRTMAESAGVVHHMCKAVAPDQVPDHYLVATYGFILRDRVLLNQVACPTKLVEYMHWGVIPVVLCEEIGDFAELGFRFVSIANFRAGRLPDPEEASAMRHENREIVQRLIMSCENELSTLRDMFRK